MNKYENGKIYKIEPINGNEEDVYVGSTTEKYLSTRISKHKSNFKCYQNGIQKGRNTCYELFEKYGIDNCLIILLETVKCNSKEELLARERFYIKSLKCINKRIEGRTKKEYNEQYYNDNKEKFIENVKKYEENNKEKVKAYREKWRDDNRGKYSETFVCDCGSVSQLIKKDRHFKSKKHLDFNSKVSM